MRPRERRETGQNDFFKARLDQIVDMNHALAKLAATIDWGFLEKSVGAVYDDGPGEAIPVRDRGGQPPLPTRLMAGLAILKHMHNLSDEILCERWIENPYYQLFCGEEFFRRKLPFDRSSITRWRQRMGEDKLVALLQESLAAATRSGAAKPSDFAKVIVDTTVQPKAAAFPADAKLMHRGLCRLARLTKKHGMKLRQSYRRGGKFALIRQQRYAHAKQFKRARRALKTLKTYLGRVIRDIGRKIAGNERLKEVFATELMLARRVHAENKNLRPVKGAPAEADLRVFSLHAPEVECIGKGKAHQPYEFGVKVSVAAALNHSKGGQFIVHAKALPGKPYDGHTSPAATPPSFARRSLLPLPLGMVIPEIEKQIGVSLKRIFCDAGYKGHNAPEEHRFKVYTAGQRRRMTDEIKREMRRRPAIEPAIGHAKSEHRMGRNYLAGAAGDAINAVLAAAGYNFRRLLAWFSLLLSAIWTALTAPGRSQTAAAAA